MCSAEIGEPLELLQYYFLKLAPSCRSKQCMFWRIGKWSRRWLSLRVNRLFTRSPFCRRVHALLQAFPLWLPSAALIWRLTDNVFYSWVVVIGLEVQGLFRIPGNTQVYEEMLSSLMKGQPLNQAYTDLSTIHNVSSAFKVCLLVIDSKT